jgi:hypothetical protein
MRQVGYSHKNIGKHYTGPTWESNDGSKVIGEVKASDNGPDTNAIPWLLLNTKSTEGNGIFSKTQSVQRVKTVGGKAPVDGCNQAQGGQGRADRLSSCLLLIRC